MDQSPYQTQSMKSESADTAASPLPPVPVVATATQTEVETTPVTSATTTDITSLSVSALNAPDTISSEYSTIIDTEAVRASSTPVMGRPRMDAIVWSASEYVEHAKSTMWFIWLGVVTVIGVAVAIFVLKQYTFALLLVVMAIAVVIWARRPAHEVCYELSTSGILINDRQFPFNEFRAFGVIQDNAIYYAVLLPTKRFSPGVNVYFPSDMGEQIVDMLGAALPMEQLRQDFIDKLTSRLNF